MSNKQDLTTLKSLLQTELSKNADNLSDATLRMYSNQLIKVYKQSVLDKMNLSPRVFINRIRAPKKFNDPEFHKIFGVDPSDISMLVEKCYTSYESLVSTYNAICKLCKLKAKTSFEYYSKIRKVYSNKNKINKLDNELTPKEQEKYISYDELQNIPKKIKDDIIRKYGSLFISQSDLNSLKNGQRKEYLRYITDYMILQLNITYPIRLIWPTVQLTADDTRNYLDLNNSVLHVNKFKNLRLMGPQQVKIDRDTMKLIHEYIDFIRATTNSEPTMLLYRLYHNELGPFDYNPDKNNFTTVLSNLFKKYNKKPLNMNMIRHITESNIIQNPAYSKLTNREKANIHAQLLHSTIAANLSYNKIANRSTTSSHHEDHSYDYEQPTHEVEHELPTTKNAKRRVFTASFGSAHDNEYEIDIYKK